MTACALVVASTLAGGGGATDPLPWDLVSFRTHVDAATGLSLPVPLTGVLLTSRHFADAREGQMTDVLTFTGRDTEWVELGVFDNPRHRELSSFVDETLPFLRLGPHTEMPWLATPRRVPARLFEAPRTGQQYGRRSAVFLLGSHVVVVSCRNLADRAAVSAFEALVERLEPKR
jgi:hypothetical protein